MPSELKELMVGELTAEVGELENCAFVDYSGLTAQQARGLRVKLRETQSRFLVMRNRLARRVLTDELSSAVPDLFAGSTAVVYSEGDVSALLKLLTDWGKKNRQMPVKGGLVDGRAMTAEQMGAVAKLPPTDVLRSMFLSVITAPMSGLLRLLNEPRRRMVTILDQKLKGASNGEAAGEVDSSEA